MGSQPTLIVPDIEGSRYRWRFGDVSFEVDAAVGARVIGFRIGAENILVGPEVNPLNYGSTFWSSPQAAWGWPPVREIDIGPYEVSGEGPRLVFESAPGGAMKIVVSKRFHVDSDRETVTIEYGMENRGGESWMIAPWEISRVPTGGLTFFPKGGGVQGPSTLGVVESEGVIWFDYDPAPITDHQKVFVHGNEGWVAHVDTPRRMLLIKTFTQVDRAEQAPGEAEIELYADPLHSYVEVEQQGACRSLPAGERVTWTVVWRLRRVPLGIDVSVGSKDLIALVRALASASPPAV